MISLSAEMLTKNERKVSQPIPTPSVPDDPLRQWAQQHVERIHRLKLHVAAYLLGMIVLTPLWALVEWQANGSFGRWSDNSNPGDWEPWILYVGFIWGFVVAFMALRTYFDRPATEAEIDAEIRRVRPSA